MLCRKNRDPRAVRFSLVQSGSSEAIYCITGLRYQRLAVSCYLVLKFYKGSALNIGGICAFESGACICYIVRARILIFDPCMLCFDRGFVDTVGLQFA